jgi:hypothetical protein
MDAATITAIATSLFGLIAALAAAFTTVRKSQVESLEKRVEVLEADLHDEREAHAAERDAHSKTRQELAEAYARLRQCLGCPIRAEQRAEGAH